MTQAVTNTLNNLEQMLSVKKDTQKAVDSVASGMDKSTDFKKVFDSKIAPKEPARGNSRGNLRGNSKADLKAEKSTSTIKDLKENSIDLKDTMSVAKGLISSDFKEILEKATDEANVETSLDLTLARDINEIISQLKEAIEGASELISDDTEVPEEIVSTDDELSENALAYELLAMEQAVPSELSKDILAEQEMQNETLGSKISIGQMLTQLVDDSMKTEVKSGLLESNLKNVEMKSLESFENTQTELIEFAENTVEEYLPTKQADDSLVNEIENLLDEESIKNLKIESLSAETDTSGGETLMQNQTPEEYAVKAMINQEVETFEIKVDSVQNAQNSQPVQPKTVDVNPSRIIDQITKHLEGLHSNSKVNIVLNPESLGKVNIQLMNTKDGLTAQFTVTTQEARDLLTKGLDGLKETLAAHGVGVDNVSVKVADAQKSEYSQDWTEQEGSRGGNKGQKNPDREEKQKGMFEKMMAQASNDENGNV